MNVLLTGAFGNIGFSTLQELIRQGYQVRCFDLKTPATEKKAHQVASKAEVVWGDVRDPAAVARAVEGQEVILHLAFIIPPAADDDPERAYAVNMGGTRNLLEAAQKVTPRPKFFFASSFDVYGNTQDKEPPRRVNDPLQPIDEYSKQKVECESLVQHSGLDWAIYRFCDVPPQVPHSPHPIMFRIPLETRFEMLHSSDAGLAIVNGLSRPIWGKIWLIGGGTACQIRYKDYLQTMMKALGIGELPAQAFGTTPYCTDWLDSSESQALLQYQRHTFEDIMREMTAAANPGPLVRFLMPAIRPLVRRSILRMSPYFKKA